MLLEVYLALYDILLDDEKEIREKASGLVSWVLSLPNSAVDANKTADILLTPVAAITRLAEFLATTYNGTMFLCIEGLKRICGIVHPSAGCPGFQCGDISLAEFEGALPLVNVEHELRMATMIDSTLFIEERQNLFIDPIQESERWTKVLQKTSMSSLSSEHVVHLEKWVVHGLEVFTAEAVAHTDGPLGWTSKAEVFTLGMRVFFVAQLLLDRLKAEQEDAGGGDVRSALMKLLEAGRNNGLHELWLENIKAIAES
jgi:hypothetical protein